MPIDRTIFFNSESHSPTLIDSHAQEESQAWGAELVNQPIPSDCFLFAILYWMTPPSGRNCLLHAIQSHLHTAK